MRTAGASARRCFGSSFFCAGTRRTDVSDQVDVMGLKDASGSNGVMEGGAVAAYLCEGHLEA